MAENKAKKVLLGQVRLPKTLDRAINMEASRLDCYKYEVVQAAWEAYEARKNAVPKSEQAAPFEAPCPYCSHALRIEGGSITKGMGPESVPKTGKTQLSTSVRAPLGHAYDKSGAHPTGQESGPAEGLENIPRLVAGFERAIEHAEEVIARLEASGAGGAPPKRKATPKNRRRGED